MGKSSNSHGQKTDKETQSPILKIFKDIMQREKNNNGDLEKAHLTQEKKKSKRKKSSSSKSRSRSGEKFGVQEVQIGASLCNRFEKSKQYSQPSHSVPITGEKRDSWWFWGNNECHNAQVECGENAEDTRSCAYSCALKRILTSDYACVGCLLVIFIISATAAFMTLFRTIPIVAVDVGTTEAPIVLYTNVFKREVSKLNAMKRTGNMISDSLSQHLEGIRNGKEQSRTSKSPYGYRSRSNLPFKLGSDAFITIDKNHKLKEFYKKLLETDAQILKLKKNLPFEFDAENQMVDRRKRSLLRRTKHKKTTKKPNIMHRKLIKAPKNINKPNITKDENRADKTISNQRRNKRFDNNYGNATGFVIQKERILIKYKPFNYAKKTTKPKTLENIYREKNTKATQNVKQVSYHKTSNKFDDMLQQYLNKNKVSVFSPMEVSHPSASDDVVGDGANVKSVDNLLLLKTTKEYMIKPSWLKDLTFDRSIKSDSSMELTRHTKRHDHDRFKFEGTTDFEGPLSFSTILDAQKDSASFVGRRLLQNEEEEEEGIGYEDFNEVLSDDVESHHDEEEKKQERNKRNDVDVSLTTTTSLGCSQNFPDSSRKMGVPSPQSVMLPTVSNPNWKGPMPLYPEELTNEASKPVQAMRIKPVGIDLILNKDVPLESDLEKELSDVEYIEDYFENKYEKLAKMAQAYSDYGVLESKKDNTRNDNAHQAIMKVDRVKMAAPKSKKQYDYSKQDDANASRVKNAKIKAAADEGFKIGMRAWGQVQPADRYDLFGHFPKHFKVIGGGMNNDKLASRLQFSRLITGPKTNITEIQADNGFPNEDYIVKENDTARDYNVSTVFFVDNKKKYKAADVDNTFSLGKVHRSLKSFDESLDDFDGPFDGMLLANDEFNYNINKSNGAKIKRSGLKDIAKARFEHRKLNKKPMNTSTKLENITDLNEWEDVDVSETELDIPPLFEVSANITAYRNATVKPLEFRRNDSKISVRVFDPGDIDMENERNISVLLNNLNNIQLDDDFPNSTIFEFTIANETDLASKVDSIVLDSETRRIDSELPIVNETEVNSNKTTPNPLDFLFMLSNFFNALTGLAFDVKKPKDTSSHIASLVSSLNSMNKSDSDNKTKDIVYPMYDADMIDNIGHRSRVLFSIEEETESSVPVKGNDKNIAKARNSEEIVTDEPKLISNVSSEINDQNNLTKSEIFRKGTKINIKLDKVDVNKTVVKRDAEESNLIFWNDIYDDEYGIQIESNLNEEIVKDKDLPVSDEVVKKSEVWFQDKVKKLTDSVKKRSKDGIKSFYGCYNKRKARDTLGYATKTYQASKRETLALGKNGYNYYEDEVNYAYEEVNPQHSFALLKAHMKKVCKQAALAVQKTRHVKDKEDEPEKVASISLMQQLVNLMMDLVDYQVEKTTCLTLPADLKEFLVWLTAVQDDADAKEQDKEKIKPLDIAGHREMDYDYLNDVVKVEPSKKDLLKDHRHKLNMPSMPYGDHDTRSECLGTLKAIEELILRYDHLSEEDKSKMIGVREYLEHQLEFLNKQLDAFEEYNMSKLNRKRRDLQKIHKHRKRHSCRPGHEKTSKRLKKFMRNFSKRHTKTTSNSFDNVQISTDVLRKDIVVDSSNKLRASEDSNVNPVTEDPHLNGNESKGEQNNEKVSSDTKLKDSSKSIAKRNLKEDYSSPVEVKKYSTIKGSDKQHYDGFERPDLIRIQH